MKIRRSFHHGPLRLCPVLFVREGTDTQPFPKRGELFVLAD